MAQVKGNSKFINRILTWDALNVSGHKGYEGRAIYSINAKCTAGEIAELVITYHCTSNEEIQKHTEKTSAGIFLETVRIPIRSFNVITAGDSVEASLIKVIRKP